MRHVAICQLFFPLNEYIQKQPHVCLRLISSQPGRLITYTRRGLKHTCLGVLSHHVHYIHRNIYTHTYQQKIRLQISKQISPSSHSSTLITRPYHTPVISVSIRKCDVYSHPDVEFLTYTHC